ncbi:MAG: ABC-F family ATP-binding cassette domain-containing protein [Hyphomicrobiales bacterium]|nr:ABC-F family ATP-binding cassette domain-containing protein [Hyphomicrobiales bacterium]
MLSIDGLTYRIGPRLLLEDATVFVPAGARVGLVGRNGVGKSTLFRLIRGEIVGESGEVSFARGARLGGVEQEAPGGPTTLIDFTLAADRERAALLEEAETARDPARIAEVHARLLDIDAHSAPARAARILAGLGFDEAAQARPLSSYSGGWRMRVALAAALFAAPDLLLLDEPTNYLDLEGALWLVEHLASYRATVVVISHDRDVLDAACDSILHLDRGKLTFWSGNYSDFEERRRQKLALDAKRAKEVEAKRKHLQAFVDRFRAKASKAAQAQSRIKMLAKLEQVATVADNDVAPFDFPSPERPLSPPIISLDGASAGYDGRTVLSGLSLSLAEDDRVALLGANGNGKSTFAKLIAGRLAPQAGRMVRAPKLRVGFFAQHQADDLDSDGTPLTHVARLMPGAPTAKVRAKVAQFGFPGERAQTRVAELSGGEKARLLFGLATYDAPHLLILDEPTNHLDMDSRDALADAINAYEGAVVLIAHDRRLLESCADRLWLVADGTVKPFDGDMDDYRRLVLSGDAAPSARGGRRRKTPPAAAAANADETPARSVALRKAIAEAEGRMARLNGLIGRVDAALAVPGAFARDPRKAAELARNREELERALRGAEEAWLDLSAKADA